MPIPLIDFQQGSMGVDCGMVDQDVDAAEVIFHLLDDSLHADLLGNIFCVGADSSATLLDKPIQVDGRYIVGSYLGAMLCQQPRRGPARSPACPGDQRHLALDAIHQGTRLSVPYLN